MKLLKHGDGLEGLSRISSVDAVITDPPSGKTRAERDRKPDLDRFWSAVWGALKPHGVAVVMASHIDFACELIASSRKEFRYDLVWHKSLPTGFLNASKRPLRAHEHVLVFFREFWAFNPQRTTGHGPVHAALRTSTGENYNEAARTRSNAGATDRMPTSVLRISSVGTSSKEREHPQQKPDELARYLVRTYTNSGELVVDPFAGSGVFVRVAVEEGRRAMGWELYP